MVPYLVSQLAAKWAEDGNIINFVTLGQRFQPADLALLHIDLTVVPKTYVNLARRYPRVLNDKVLDIRKSLVSQNLIRPESSYEGPVIVKTDLNAGGNPEHLYEKFPVYERRIFKRWWKSAVGRFTSSTPSKPGKRYKIYECVKDVPECFVRNNDYVVEKFLPEVMDGLYITRRCHLLGDRSVTHKMGWTDPLGGGFAASFEWVKTNPAVLDVAKNFGLEYGAIDYTEIGGVVNAFDINKTIGLGALEHAEVRENNAKLVDLLAPGIYSF